MGLLDNQNIGNLSWDELYKLRLQSQGNQQMQGLLAPFEHRAYAREEIARNPLAAPVWAVMPAAYQLNKLIGLGSKDSMTTPPSLTQMGQGMMGVWDGLKEWWQR